LGERHDNPEHHTLQARLLGGMIAAGRRPAVGFEMLSTDDATAIARYLARSPKDASGLGEAVSWNRSGWPDWRLYEPIAQWALDARMAEALVRAGQRDGAILIAGAGHVRTDRGVPFHLQRRAPGATVVSVAFLEVEATVDAPAGYAARFEGALPFDYVWFT